jgi:hypothetical protein
VSRQAGQFFQNLQKYNEELMDELSAPPEDEDEEKEFTLENS